MAIPMIVTESRCEDIGTTFPYLDRSLLYRSQKPFATDFIPSNPNVPLSNHNFDYMDLVVTDAQQFRDCFSVEKNGFCFLKSETALRDKNSSVDEPEYVETYYFAEIEALLHRTFPEYTRFECLDHQIRKRSSLFPQRPGEIVADAQPAVLPHSDFSTHGLFLCMEHFFPGQKVFYEGRDFDILNVWRVLKGPNNDWPLAVCDYQSINMENDVIPNDVLHEDCVGENWLLHKAFGHAWYYLSNQEVEDVIVFRNADSLGKRSTGFHAAFDTATASSQLRESIEVRVAAFR